MNHLDYLSRFTEQERQEVLELLDKFINKYESHIEGSAHTRYAKFKDGIMLRYKMMRGINGFYGRPGCVILNAQEDEMIRIIKICKTLNYNLFKKFIFASPYHDQIISNDLTNLLCDIHCSLYPKDTRG